jgi:small GTP-binding protein
MAMNKFYKVILVGEVNVGKTSLLLRYTKGQFHEKCPPDVEYEEKVVEIEGHSVPLRIFDTAGQECFR